MLSTARSSSMRSRAVTVPPPLWLNGSTTDRRTLGSSITSFSAIDLPSSSRRKLNRSEEHTSELQSRLHLVCRLLLEKKKKKITHQTSRAPSILISPFIPLNNTGNPSRRNARSRWQINFTHPSSSCYQTCTSYPSPVR